MEYTLNCLVPGAADTFPIEVKETQLVGKLKEEIKKKKALRFKDFDADELTLHKIKVDLSDDNIMDTVSQPDYVFNPKIRLLAARRMSTYFEESSDRLEGNIHILVELPQSKSIDP